MNIEQGFYMGCGGQIGVTDLPEYELSGEYYAEPKHDGIWGSCVVGVELMEFFSRNDKRKIMEMPQLPSGAILIGELGYGSQVAVKRVAEYGHAFMDVHDCICLEDEFVNELDMEDRRELLEMYFNQLSPMHKEYFRLTPRWDKDFLKHYAEAHEGLVLKRKGGGTQFLFGDADHWIKVKKVLHVDTVVMGYDISDAPTIEGLASAIHCGVYKDGVLTHITSMGALELDVRKDIVENPEKYVGQVAELECYKIFDSGALRHPSLSRFRDDKPSNQCTWDKLMALK